VTIKFFIIAFMIFAIPFNSWRKIYLFDKGSYKIAKIINILLIVMMLIYITGPFNTIIDIFNDYNGFKEKFQIKSGLISADLNLISKIIHNILNFCMLIIIIQLLRRNMNYRKYFIYLMPILTILTTLEVNREFYRNYNENYSELLFGLAFIINAIQFLILFIIYNSKTFKEMMCLDERKIKELTLK
jgi:hypothetical protein